MAQGTVPSSKRNGNGNNFFYGRFAYFGIKNFILGRAMPIFSFDLYIIVHFMHLLVL